MVIRYFVSVRPRTNENHAVHKEGCPFLEDDEKKIYLGSFSSEKDAVKESQRHFSKTKGCIFCSGEHIVPEENPSQCELAKKDTYPVKLPLPIPFHQGLICCLN
jgi:hypothetical protein